MTAEDGIAPDLMCYNGLIRGFAGQGELDEAMRLYDRLRREGLSPDEWTYGPLLDGARAARASRLARSTSRDLEISQFWQNLQPRLQPAVPKDSTGVPVRKWFSGFFSMGSIQKPVLRL